MKNRKIVSLCLSLMTIASLLVGCGAMKESAPAAPNKGYVDMAESSVAGGFFTNDAMDYEMGYEEGYYESATEEAAPEIEGAVEPENTNKTDDYLASQKLIYTCDVNLQTLEFQKTIDSIKELIEKYDGFVESERMSDDDYSWYYTESYKNRGTLNAYIEIRIPTENYDAFLNEVEGYGKLMNKNERVTNITKSYNDTSTTIEVLEKEETMLLSMMDRAESIQDMITVEERLSTVQRQLALQRSSLYSMDVDIAYSTINVDIQEVMEYTYKPEETTLFQRLWDACKDSVEEFGDFLEGLVTVIIYVLPYAIILVAAIYIFVRRVVRKRVQEKLQNVKLEDQAETIVENETKE